MGRSTLLLCCGPLALLLCGIMSLILTRLASGLDLRMVHPVQGGSGEISWASMHWLGLRNLALLLAWVPGYAPVHWAARPSLGTAGPTVALTIDDAVGENTTGVAALLDLLDEHKVPATFFVIANDAFTFGPGRPKILKEMIDRGHEIGNHGVEDAAMASLGAAEVEEALTLWEDRVRPAVQTWPQRESDWKWFRPPQGMMSQIMAEVLTKRGYSIALGDVYSDDWLIQDTEYHARVIEGVAMDGSVIILHAPDRPTRMHTLDILREVIPYLHSRGYSFVRLSDLYRGDHPRDDLKSTCVACVAVAALGGLAFGAVAVFMACHGVLRFSISFRQRRGYSAQRPPLCKEEKLEIP